MRQTRNTSELASPSFQKHATVLIKQLVESEKSISEIGGELADAFDDVGELITEMMGAACVALAKDSLSKDRETEILVSLSQVIGDIFSLKEAASIGDSEKLRASIELMRKRITVDG